MKAINYPMGTALVDPRCLTADAINVLLISAGKDSLAQWILALDAGANILPVFADTGHEHPETMEYLDYLESRLGPVRRVKADFAKRIAGKRAFIAERWPKTLVTECGFTDERAAAIVQIALIPFTLRGSPFLICVCGKGAFPALKPDSVLLS